MIARVQNEVSLSLGQVLRMGEVMMNRERAYSSENQERGPIVICNFKYIVQIQFKVLIASNENPYGVLTVPQAIPTLQIRKRSINQLLHPRDNEKLGNDGRGKLRECGSQIQANNVFQEVRSHQLYEVLLRGRL